MHIFDKFKDTDHNYISTLAEDGLVTVKLLEKVGRSWRCEIGNGEWFLIGQRVLTSQVQTAGGEATLPQRNEQVDYREVEISSGEEDSEDDHVEDDTEHAP